ncbi:PqiC family protein [Pseudomonas sp. G.S.17]|uniref:PqiC family protein n=1 Tax=Pseudomonas sp. G.S.17 TaxID=3137451 RepID=UPI00311C8D98
MTLRLKFFVLAALLGTSACTSTVTHYYTLIAPATTTAQKPVAVAPFQFEMLPVLMPVQVDQPPLVIRQGDGSLAILDAERWGSPLGDEFHDALTGQLERRFGSRDMAGLPKDSGQTVLSLRTDVRRFESVPGSYAMIDVVWSLGLRNAGTKAQNLTCSSVIREPAGLGMENLVLAHQRAVSRLADTIARTAGNWAQDQRSRCL